MRQLTHQPAQPPASTAPRPDRSDRGPIGLSGVPYEFRSFLKFSKFVEKTIIIGMRHPKKRARCRHIRVQLETLLKEQTGVFDG